jgi:hypothetical protein
MNPLTDVRAALASTLESAGFRTYDHTPETFTPPGAVVSYAGTDALELGAAFKLWKVNFVVKVLVGHGTNKVTTSMIEDALFRAMSAIRQSGFKCTGGDIGVLTLANGTEALGAVIRVTSGDIQL